MYNLLRFCVNSIMIVENVGKIKSTKIFHRNCCAIPLSYNKMLYDGINIHTYIVVILVSFISLTNGSVQGDRNNYLSRLDPKTDGITRVIITQTCTFF